MATTLGLCGRALDLPITIAESNNGLVPPAVATHMLGHGGPFLILLQLFMAVTASAASEQIGISSIVSYDVYKRYIAPGATGKQIVFVARCAILGWAIVSGCLSIILHELDIGLGWVYLAMGNFIGSAVFPVAFALTWKDCSAEGAMLGTWLGAGFSMLGWCLCAHGQLNPQFGKVNVDSLGDDFSMLTGNLIALLLSPVITVCVSLARPQNFDWRLLRERTEEMLIEDDIAEADRVSHSVLLGLHDEAMVPSVSAAPSASAAAAAAAAQDSEEALTKVLRFSYWFGGGLSFVLIVLWPLLALPEVNFSKSHWGFWVAIAFIWGHCAAAITIVLPLWEVRDLFLIAVGLRKAPEPPQSVAAEKVEPSQPVQTVRLDSN
jgi:Na+/proline symporter